MGAFEPGFFGHTGHRSAFLGQVEFEVRLLEFVARIAQRFVQLEQLTRLRPEFHLSKEGGSMTRVAEKTGLERTHLYRKLKQLGVDLTRNKRGG